MAQDFGIIITQPGVSVVNAKTSQISMNTSNPFIKLDTQNPKAFQTITLLVTTDPPEPVLPVTDAYTVLYQFAHGYKYVPSVEALFTVTSPAGGPGGVNYQAFFQDYGIVSTQTPGDAVFIYSLADATNVYIMCDKYDAIGNTNLLTGLTMSITTHVFVEDIGV